MHDEIEKLGVENIEDIQTKVEMTSTALRLASAGQTASAVAGIVNTMALVSTTLGAEVTGDVHKWLPKGWVIFSLAAINVANWSGFVLFNVLGNRNAELVKRKIKILSDNAASNAFSSKKVSNAPLAMESAAATLDESKHSEDDTSMVATVTPSPAHISPLSTGGLQFTLMSPPSSAPMSDAPTPKEPASVAASKGKSSQ